jgi:nucleotide-binding universal stress UspA family protein
VAAGPVIICYDGSKAAESALRNVADLLPGARALVVVVWKPILEAILAVSFGPAPPIADPVEADERQARAAATLADQGSRRAAEAGLEPEPLAVQAEGAIWETIAELAEDRDARLIVCGAGRAGLSSTLLDALPTALIHRASRPVFVVPSTDASTERRRDLSDKRAERAPARKRAAPRARGVTRSRAPGSSKRVT